MLKYTASTKRDITQGNIKVIGRVNDNFQSHFYFSEIEILSVKILSKIIVSLVFFPLLTLSILISYVILTSARELS